MSHEPGRENFIIHRCEHCAHRLIGPGIYVEDVDEYWCESCVDNKLEAAYERQQESNLESPPESSREEQLRTWEEHQKAHKR